MLRFLVWVGFVVGLNDLPSVIKISSAIAPDCSNSDFSLSALPPVHSNSIGPNFILKSKSVLVYFHAKTSVIQDKNGNFIEFMSILGRIISLTII